MKALAQAVQVVPAEWERVAWAAPIAKLRISSAPVMPRPRAVADPAAAAAGQAVAARVAVPAVAAAVDSEEAADGEAGLAVPVDKAVVRK